MLRNDSPGAVCRCFAELPCWWRSTYARQLTFRTGTTIAIIRRWENLNQEFKVGKPSSKAKSSPAGTPPKSTPAKAKSRSPKETGKKVTFDQPSTPCSTPNQSNDGTMSPEDALMQPKRWSSREQSRKNYAEIDVPESNGEEMDSSEEVEFEAVEIKTE